MIIKSVDIIPDGGGKLTLTLDGTEEDEPYLIRTMVGLDADEITSQFYGKGIWSKEGFYNILPGKREIVMRIVMNPDWSNNETYSGLRDELYRVVSSSRTGLVELHFNSAAGSVSMTKGFIRKFEAPHFSKTAEVQLTFEAKKEFRLLRGLAPVVLEGADLVNDGAGEYLVTDTLSTAPHGAVFTVSCDTTTPADTEFELSERDFVPEWRFRVADPENVLTNTWNAGDEIIVNSTMYEQALTVERSSTVYTLAEQIINGATWPTIFPGQNTFYVPSAYFSITKIEYYPAYWGI